MVGRRNTEELPKAKVMCPICRKDKGTFFCQAFHEEDTECQKQESASRTSSKNLVSG